eukprot:TRINITY_DN2205_c0_g2_i1.p1 TRINITY_DN2205_c0_g2~~TRINITY_DN2205_c0_g2_i1.p1  ORF type:complete len:1064 (+),score=342.99 TRINITY_DN2205_c0_g2_i1:37-3228(+)
MDSSRNSLEIDEQDLVSTPDKFGRLPIHVACENETNSQNIIQLLHLYKKAIAVPNNFTRMVALHYACGNPHVTAEVISLLLLYYPDAVQLPDKESRLPIHHACANKNVNEEVIRSLLAAYPASAQAPNANMQYPLHLASSNESANDVVLRMLIDAFPKSTSIPDLSNQSNLPLHNVAAMPQTTSSVRKIRVLVEKDASCASKQNANSLSPLMMAEADGKLQYLMYMLNIIPTDAEIPYTDDLGFFWKAMDAANSVIVTACLKKNGDLVLETRKGERPLQMSIRCGHKNLFDLLLVHITSHEKYKHLLLEPDTNQQMRTPIQMAISKLRSAFLNTLFAIPEVKAASEKDKFKLLTEATKTTERDMLTHVINAFKWKLELPEGEEKEEEEKGGLDLALSFIKSAVKRDKQPERPLVEWDLSNQSLEVLAFPKEISQVEVEVLKLSINKFKGIPVEALQIKTLKKIILDRNFIMELDDKAIKAFRKHPNIRYVDLSYNYLRAIPPELFSLPKCEFDTSGNPLAGGLVFPAWFFGLTFGNHNYFAIFVMDAIFLVLGTLIVLFGYLAKDSPNLGYIMLTLLIGFFGLFFIGTLYMGVYGIPWTDSIFASRVTAIASLIDIVLVLEDDDEGEDEVDDPNSLAEAREKLKKVIKDKAMEIKDKYEDKVKDGIKEVKEKAEEIKEKAEQLKDQIKDAIDEHKENLKGIFGFITRNANVIAIFTMLSDLPALFSFSFDIPSVDWPKWIGYLRLFVLKFDEWTSGYEVGFWVAVAGALIQRILFEMARNSKMGKYCAVLLSSIITATNLPIFVQLTKSLICTYDIPGKPTLDAYPPDEFGNPKICWEGDHLYFASISLFVFMIYYPMAVLSVPVWQQRAKGLTITFPSYFLILVGQSKFVLTLITTAFSTRAAVYLSTNMVISVALFALGISLPTMKNAVNTDIILTKTKVKIGRIGSYFGVVLSAIGAVLVYNLPSISLPIVITLIVVQVVITISTILLIKLATARFEKRRNFRPFFKFTEEERRKKMEELQAVELGVVNEGQKKESANATPSGSMRLRKGENLNPMFDEK